LCVTLNVHLMKRCRHQTNNADIDRCCRLDTGVYPPFTPSSPHRTPLRTIFDELPSEADGNLYNIKTHRTATYDSTHEVIPCECENCHLLGPDGRRLTYTKHNSLEGAYSKSIHRTERFIARNLSSSCIDYLPTTACTGINGPSNPPSYPPTYCIGTDAPSVHQGSICHLKQLSDILPNRKNDRHRPTHCRQISLDMDRFGCSNTADKTAARVTCSSRIGMSEDADGSIMVARGKHFVEVSKPFEMSDVKKYGTRHRLPKSIDIPPASSQSSNILNKSHASSLATQPAAAKCQIGKSDSYTRGRVCGFSDASRRSRSVGVTKQSEAVMKIDSSGSIIARIKGSGRGLRWLK